MPVVVVGESTSKMEIKPRKSSTPTSSSSKKHLRPSNCELKDDPMSAVSHVHGEGDSHTFGSGKGATANQMEPDFQDGSSEMKKTPSGLRNSFQRVKASLSKTQSQIVELFSRENPRRCRSVRKLGRKGEKKLEMDTIVASLSSSSSGEPRLVAHHRNPSTSMISPCSESHHDHNTYRNQTADNIEEITEKSKGINGRYHSSSGILSSSKQQPSSLAHLPNTCGAHFVAQTEEGLQDIETLRIDEGKELDKLRQENHQLWEDNQFLTAHVEDMESQLERAQNRNRYLEMALYQENKVLSDIIKSCHKEIARLKITQCELMSDSTTQDRGEDTDCAKQVREYYIDKYST